MTLGLLLSGQSLACEPPPGFVYPPRPEIAPLRELLSHTEVKEIGPYGTVGARRLVCKTDGHIAVEEVLLTESNGDSNRFRYVVWNQTGPKYRDVDYAVGEFLRMQPAPGKTLVSWTYRFALKSGISSEERSRFQETFLKRELSEWMRTQLDRKPSDDEAKPSK